MTRKILLPLLTMMVLLVLALIPNRASAQWNNPNCCTYTIDINGVDATCFPFKVETFWSDGSADSNPFFNNGIFIQPIPGGPVPCPPAPQFKGVRIDGSPVVGPGQTMKVKTASGCCLLVTAALDGGGCLYIKISPCP